MLNAQMFRIRLAVALPARVSGNSGAGQRWEQQVVLERLVADLAEQPRVERLVVGQRASAGDEVLDLEVVQRDAPTRRRPSAAARRPGLPRWWGVPLLVLVHAQDAVADVAVLAEDVGEGVVDVVVAVLPLVRGADVVPPRTSASFRPGSPIQSYWPCMTLWPISILSRIFEIDRAATANGQGRRQVEQGASGDLELALPLDDVADVGSRPSSPSSLITRWRMGVQLLAQALELLGGEAGWSEWCR